MSVSPAATVTKNLSTAIKKYPLRQRGYFFQYISENLSGFGLYLTPDIIPIAAYIVTMEEPP